MNRTTVWYAAAGTVLAALFVFVGLVTFPGLVGGDDVYIVTSDSMQPTIESGDVIITQEVDPDAIESGDVVTFQDGSGTDGGTLTHRVVEVREENGERYFRTKGDANEDPDEGYVPAEYAQGTLHVHVPYLGYLLLFARSSLGLFALVIAPGLFLVASGSWQLLREFGYAPTVDRVLEGILGPDGSDDDQPAIEGESIETPALESADDAPSDVAPEPGNARNDAATTEGDR
ncbi:signal peptidase I [Halosolutus amylolyticus]|uniref:Signal peptidase I n=1 Tax=Halosolutus amylolyticus TaxID=2932267 RepID=A0ABD5PMU0_9EURY|nr:signal peptidase I [Halosolutus amylolyticus]